MQQKVLDRAAASLSTGSQRLPGMRGGPAGWIKHFKSIAIYTDWDWGAGTIKYRLFHPRCSFGLHIDACYFISHEWLCMFFMSFTLSLSLFCSHRTHCFVRSNRPQPQCPYTLSFITQVFSVHRSFPFSRAALLTRSLTCFQKEEVGS